MHINLRFTLACIFLVFCNMCYAYDRDNILGVWTGETTNYLYLPAMYVPLYKKSTFITVTVSRNVIRGISGDKCGFIGEVRQGYGPAYHIVGSISKCPEKRMNGRFNGSFDEYGNIKLTMIDKYFNRAIMQGKVSRIRDH
jgi:hypothetical protein